MRKCDSLVARAPTEQLYPPPPPWLSMDLKSFGPTIQESDCCHPGSFEHFQMASNIAALNLNKNKIFLINIAPLPIKLSI